MIRTSFLALAITGLAVSPALAAPPATYRIPAAAPSSALAAEFAKRYPGAWHVSIDARTGRPAEIYGTGIDLGRRLDDRLAVLEEAFSFLEANRGYLGLLDLDLDGEPVLAGTTWYLNLGLVHEGVPFVPTSRVDLRFKPRGVLAAVLTNGIPREIEPATPERSAQDATRFARDTARSLGATRPRTGAEPTLRYVVTGDATARLAWRVRVRSEDAVPFGRDFFVSARGELRLLRERQLVHRTDLSGDVRGRGHKFNPRSNLREMALRRLDLQITETGVTGQTGALGNFTLPNEGTDPVTLVAELRGSFVDVNTVDGGTDLRYEKQHVPGVPAEVRFHPAPQQDPRQAAQVNGYFHTTAIHDYLRGILDVPALDVPIPCNVNDTRNHCNAFYTDGTINFFVEGNGCVNMAFDTIIYHEYGHFLDDVLGGILDTTLTEGLADMIAVLASGQPLIGEEYRTGEAFLRTADNDRVWPAPECGNSVHCVGETFAGFAWHARERLIRSLGETAGVAVAERDFLQSLHGNAMNIPRAVLEVFLQDDDDGDLGNRTPNFRQLAFAAVRHGFDPPTVPLFTFTHTELPFAVADPVNDVPVTASFVPAAPGPLTETTLLYTIDDSSVFNEVVMTPAGDPDTFGASIPAQECGTWIKYFFRVRDSFGNTRVFPPEAPGPLRRKAFSFHIGRAKTLLFEDFESGFGGWTHAADAGEDDWEVAAPNPDGSHPFDPPEAFSGTQVAGNDLTMDGDYPDDADNVLRSPVIDGSAFENVWVKFRYWLSVERSTRDSAKFRVENATPFQNDQRRGTASTAWLPFERDVSIQGAGNPELNFEFRLATNEAFHAGGWNIDDFEVQSVSCDLVTLAFDKRVVGIGQPITLDIRGGTSEPYFLLSAHAFGPGVFQVPGGPLVETGLSENQKLRAQGTLDAMGKKQITRTVPNNPLLVGKHFIFVAISRNGDWLRSNFFELDVTN